MASCNLPHMESFIPSAPFVPSVHMAPSHDHIMMPLILARFDTLERMVLGLYQSSLNPPMTRPLNPVNAPHVEDKSQSSAQPPARSKKPVPIVNPDASSSPEHSASGTPEPRVCDKCEQPFTPSNSKWKICDSCDAARRQDARKSKLRKGKIPCDTENCVNTVSPNSASGLCHVCWWKEHVKCHFCPGTLRSSEESHVCGRCRNRFRTWHRVSGKNGYRVTEQSGQVGRLFAKGGRFEPFSDQEEATAKLSNYREFIEVTALDETERRNSASRRRADRVKERESQSEKALSKWKSGLSVTFVPTESEALQDANASCPEETSTHPVQHIPHLPHISGMSAAPSIDGRKPLPTHTTDRNASSTDEGTGLEFPTSSGKYHTMLNAGFSKSVALSFDEVTFRPYGGYPHVPASSKRTPISESDSESLLPKGETFRSTRPGCAIPIVAPPEIRESLFPKVPPTATRTNSTSVKPPLVKDRGSGIDDTFSSAPSPALDEALTTSVDVTLERVVAPQLPMDLEHTSESLKGGSPKVPRLPQPPPTAAINAGDPSQAEISKSATGRVPLLKSIVKSSSNGSLTSESDRVTKVQKPEIKQVSRPRIKFDLSSLGGLLPASDVTTPVAKPQAKDTTPPKKSTFTSSLLTTHDVRLEETPHFLVDDDSCCTQMCSVKSCLRSGFDKHCTIPAHSGTAHRCDLCWGTYPISSLSPEIARALPIPTYVPHPQIALGPLPGFALKSKPLEILQNQPASSKNSSEPASVSKPPFEVQNCRFHLHKPQKCYWCMDVGGKKRDPDHSEHTCACCLVYLDKHK